MAHSGHSARSHVPVAAFFLLLQVITWHRILGVLCIVLLTFRSRPDKADTFKLRGTVIHHFWAHTNDLQAQGSFCELNPRISVSAVSCNDATRGYRPCMPALHSTHTIDRLCQLVCSLPAPSRPRHTRGIMYVDTRWSPLPWSLVPQCATAGDPPGRTGYRHVICTRCDAGMGIRRITCVYTRQQPQ